MRALCRAGCVFLIAVLMLSGVQAVTGAQEPEAVAGTFVGMIETEGGGHADDILVAIVADAPTGETGERRVRFYACDGQRLTEWFDDAAGPERFAMTSEDASVEGAITTTGVTGMLTLEGDESYEFTAAPATDAAGLYQIYVGEDGNALGVSTDGIAVNIDVANDMASMTFLLPDGQVIEQTLPIMQWGTGHFRLIVEAMGDLFHARGSSFKPVGVRDTGSPVQIIGICFE